MRRLARTTLVYLALFLSLVVVFCGALFVSGLGGSTVQSRVTENLASSVKQFRKEGVYPRLFGHDDQSNRLDNHTDMVILQESFFMDTASSPLSIFENPRVNKRYKKKRPDYRILSIDEAARGGEPNSNYYYYWQGFRVLVRPLLAVMDYQSIRGLVAAVFVFLMIAAAITIFRHSGAGVTAAFALAVAMMNVPIVASQLQYVTCFNISFVAIVLLPRVLKSRIGCPAFFFVIGACTQYFDFYTTPVMTLGFPLIFLLSIKRDLGVRAQAWLLARCAIAWMSAYGLMWLARLGVVSFFLDLNAFEVSFGKFSNWTGIESKELYDGITRGLMFERVFELLLTTKNKALLVLSGVALAAAAVVAARRKRLSWPTWSCLAVALLPVVWFLAAYKATGWHHWFQYRSLSVLVFGLGASLAGVVGASSSQKPPTP